MQQCNNCGQLNGDAAKNCCNCGTALQELTQAPPLPPLLPPCAEIAPRIPLPTVQQAAKSKRKPKLYGLTIFSAAIGILGLVVFVNKWPSHPDGGGNFRPPREQTGFTLEKLATASQTLSGHWTEEDPLIDDEEDWTGTTAVVNKRNGKLVLISNTHCLALEDLANADSGKGAAPDVKDYRLKVHFHNGQDRPVLRIAQTARHVDLALLEIDATGLKEGVDYTILFVGLEPYKVGDDVVAVGSPFGLDLEGTYTFGRISAIRQMGDIKMIQHHADINPGNSGGPLFLKTKSDLYLWIGVNTLGGGNGLGFAIDASEALKSEYEWVAADKEGAAQIIRKYYGQPGTTVVP